MAEEEGAWESHSCLKRMGEVQESITFLLPQGSLCEVDLSGTLEELTPFSVVEPEKIRDDFMGYMRTTQDKNKLNLFPVSLTRGPGSSTGIAGGSFQLHMEIVMLCRFS